MSLCQAISCLRTARQPFFCILRGYRRKQPPPGKPPCLPPAKTKRYRVVHVPWQKPEDVQDLLWRRIIYFDALNSIRAVIKEEYKEESKEEGVSVEEIDEFNRLIEENEAENQRMLALRSTMESESMETKKEELEIELQTKLQSKQLQINKLNAQVEEMIARSKDFITLDNMEEKIVEALGKVKCYDWAMDKQGNIYNDVMPDECNTRPPSLQGEEGFLSKTSAPLRRTDKLQSIPPIYQPRDYDPPKKSTIV